MRDLTPWRLGNIVLLLEQADLSEHHGGRAVTAPSSRLADAQVKNVPDSDNLNRRQLSALQIAILSHLATIGPARPNGDGTHHVGHWPTTGAIAVAVGRVKDNAGMASVSRSLDRLCRAGLVVPARTEVALAGRGRRYGLTDAGRSLAGAILEEPATERSSITDELAGAA
jgi:hypothetical protein